MSKIVSSIILCMVFSSSFAQADLDKTIRKIQQKKFNDGECLDFVRSVDIPDFENVSVQQIIIIRHGEPAMNKKGWKNRKEAIRYTEMYDSVGVYDFHEKPICLREMDIQVIYTSKLPRAINTAEKTFEGQIPLNPDSIFNEFERKIIKFPNIKLPRQFWSITTRVVWMMGFNHRGIESFAEAKDRAKRAAFFLSEKVENNGNAVLFAHGFLNKYLKRYLKKMGYKSLNFNGQKYLGAYYFYMIN